MKNQNTFDIGSNQFKSGKAKIVSGYPILLRKRSFELLLYNLFQVVLQSLPSK